jgi:hypothetical protein
VRRALSAIWPDPRWTPLIEALAEPFGDGLAGRVALERAEPWAEAWLAGLVEAESRCGRAPAPERSRAGQPLAAVRAVERVRSTARNYPAAKHKLVRRAYDAIGEVAQDVARREARVAMWVWGGGLVGGSVLVALNAFVMGR